MSTASEAALPRLELADSTMEFVKAFDTWVRKASVDTSGESVARLRLLYELHCNGPRKMAELADTLGVTPRNITALVDALEEEQQVRRVAHPSDRRITMIEISGGATAVQDGMDGLRSAVADLFSDVDEADRSAFERVLQAIAPKLSE